MDEYLIDLLDVYMEKYYKFYTSKDVLDKIESINCTKNLHDILTQNNNFLKLENIDKFLDKQLEKTNDIDFVINAIDYLFSNDFFKFLLKLDLSNYDHNVKSIYHKNLTLLVLHKVELYYKFMEECIDEQELKTAFLEYKLLDIINILKQIYEDICLKCEKDDYYNIYKENLMELLCSFNFEEIYLNEDFLI
jgi:hypothetical protein